MTTAKERTVRWPARALLQIGLADRHIVLLWKEPISDHRVIGYLIREKSGKHPRYIRAPSRTVLIDGLEPGSKAEFIVAAETTAGWSESSPRCLARTSGVSRSIKETWDRRLSDTRDRGWSDLEGFLKRTLDYPLLSPADEILLGKKIESEGPRGQAFQRFVNANLRLAIHWARKSQRRAAGSILDLGDLIQVAYEGLVEGVDRWDWRMGYKFSTYGSWWIRQKISREIANRARTIRIPVHLWDQLVVVLDAAEDLPSDFRTDIEARAELADLVGLDVEEVERLATLADPPGNLGELLNDIRWVDRLDEDATLGDEAWIMRAYEDGASETESATSALPASSRWWERDLHSSDALENVVDRVSAQPAIEALRGLPERTRRCVALRHGLDGEDASTLAEVGDAIGVTRERARQIINEGEQAIREALEIRDARAALLQRLREHD